jgi:hypothetical protein
VLALQPRLKRVQPAVKYARTGEFTSRTKWWVTARSISSCCPGWITLLELRVLAYFIPAIFVHLSCRRCLPKRRRRQGMETHTPGRRRICDRDRPHGPETVFAGGDDGLFRSTDGGRSWRRLPLAKKYIDGIGVDPQRSKTLYVSTEEYEVYKSTDGGLTWSRTALEDNRLEFAIDPRTRRRSTQPAPTGSSRAPMGVGAGAA